MWVEALESGYQVVYLPSPIDKVARDSELGVGPTLEGKWGNYRVGCLCWKQICRVRLVR